jgi:dihydrofolate reductase
MKTLLYMAISANGCVADAKGGTPWSDAEWKNFRNVVRSCGNIIVGRHTFEQMAAAGDFDRMGRPCVVAVSRTLRAKNICGFHIVPTPKEALKLIKAKGFSKAFIAGGTKLNSSFIEQNLADEMMLDVEPFLFGRGLPLLQTVSLQRNLKLLKATKYKGGVALHYKILKS